MEKVTWFSKRNYDFNIFSNSLKFEILDSGHAHLDSTWTSNGLMTSIFSRMYYVESGHGTVTHKGRIYHLEKDHIYFIPSYTPITFDCDSQMTKLYFNFSLTDNLNKDILSCYDNIYSVKSSSEYIKSLIDAYKEKNYTSILYVRSCIYRDLYQFIENEEALALDINKYSKTVTAAVKYIGENLSLKLNVDKIAAALDISKYILNQEFKEAFGKAPGEYIDDIIMEQAYRLVVDTDMSFKEIAVKYDFCDQYYFSQKFKNYFNQSPSVIRKRFCHKHG